MFSCFALAYLKKKKSMLSNFKLRKNDNMHGRTEYNLTMRRTSNRKHDNYNKEQDVGHNRKAKEI